MEDEIVSYLKVEPRNARTCFDASSDGFKSTTRTTIRLNPSLESHDASHVSEFALKSSDGFNLIIHVTLELAIARFLELSIIYIFI